MQRSMKKMSAKLFAAVMTLIISIVIGVSVTYAWMTLSTSPSASGATITIGGNPSIMLAPDVTETVGGEAVHYPGEFDNTLTFSSSVYSYLGNLTGLTPVSTADGINWFIPKYDSTTGELESNFDVDTTLSKANVTDGHGGYVYVDFWIVAPGADYKVRVSTDVNASRRTGTGQHEGSSLLELPPVVADSNTASGYSLGTPSGNIDSAARVGFLVHPVSATTASENAYKASANYDSRYEHIYGRFQEKGSPKISDPGFKFTIYEPNATKHVAEGLTQGAYYVTRPLGYGEGNAVTHIDVSDRLTVQKESTWKTGSGSGRLIDGHFQADISSVSNPDASVASAHLRNIVSGGGINLITTGDFIRSTQVLIANANANNAGYLSPDSVGALNSAGATDDVYIVQLEKNKPQMIRMFIWLEGEDVDCSAPGEAGADFALTLELAGAE